MNELAEEPKPPETEKSSKKTGSKPGRKSRAAKERKTPAGQGATRLRDAVNAAVDKASGRIAKALVCETCKGNASVVGIVSIGDLVNWIISAQSATISQMESYLSGR